MHCIYEFIESTPSGFTCDNLSPATSSSIALATNHALYFIWLGFGIIIFLLSVQLILWFFKQ